jgi:hypothetical protein
MPAAIRGSSAYPKTSMQMGAALGMVAGYALKQRYLGFPVRVLPWETGCQVIIRLAVLFATQMGVTFGSEAQS